MAAPAIFDLEGRVALVTGASSGIGREIASALAEAGAAVVLAARREGALEATRKGIESAGARAATLCVDLRDRAQLRDAAARAASFFGAPDILVNAAGVNIRKPLLEVEAADWDAILRVNLEAPFFLSQALVPAMIAKGFLRLPVAPPAKMIGSTGSTQGEMAVMNPAARPIPIRTSICASG